MASRKLGATVSREQSRLRRFEDKDAVQLLSMEDFGVILDFKVRIYWKPEKTT